MHKYLSLGIICSKIWTVFSQKTVSFEEQMMPKDKYANIFLWKIEAIVFISLQIFHNTCEKMFINSLLFAAWDILFSVFFAKNLWTNKYFLSSVTTLQRFLSSWIKYWTNTYHSGHKIQIEKYHLGDIRGYPQF